MYDELILIGYTDNVDENGNPLVDDYGIEVKPKETRTKIPVEIASCGQSEFFKAGESGFKPEIKAITFIGNYSGQEFALYKGIKHKIYRTFFKNDDSIELYLTKKLG